MFNHLLWVQEPLVLEPAWYAEHIWKGRKPEALVSKEAQAGTEVASSSTSSASPRVDQEVILDNVPGKIILNQLASGTGKAAYIEMCWSGIRFLFSRVEYLFSGPIARP